MPLDHVVSVDEQLDPGSVKARAISSDGTPPGMFLLSPDAALVHVLLGQDDRGFQAEVQDHVKLLVAHEGAPARATFTSRLY